MVLQSKLQARRADTENMPPAPAAKGAAANRLRDKISQHRNKVSQQRKAQSKDSAKYLAEQAKRRNDLKAKTTHDKNMLKFTVSTPSTSADVEMASPPVSRKIPIALPQQLQRPAYKEVPRESLTASYPELQEADFEYIRGTLRDYGTEMLSSLSSVTPVTQTTNVLPEKLDILVGDLQGVVPSHMVAVFGPPPKAGPSKPRKVTLYPIHSIVLAANCTNLPPFPPSSPPTSTSADQPITVPVRSLCVPSPENYPHLASFLYHHDTPTLLTAVLPERVRPAQELDDNRDAMIEFATRLGRVYTFEKLLLHALMVHGLWQNTCALGIFDDELWDAIDLGWEIMLIALAVSTGRPSLMLSPDEIL